MVFDIGNHIGIYCDNYDVIAGLILGVNWLTYKELPPLKNLHNQICVSNR